MRILLAADGSPVAARAARFVVRLASKLREKPQVLLLNIDEPLLRSVAIELGVHGVAKYHADNGKFALKTAKAVLNRAAVAYDEQLLVGNPAENIVKFAKAAKCDLVVMGSHGRSAFKSVFLGSITIKQGAGPLPSARHDRSLAALRGRLVGNLSPHRRVDEMHLNLGTKHTSAVRPLPWRRACTQDNVDFGVTTLDLPECAYKADDR